jgi:regulatory protein
VEEDELREVLIRLADAGALDDKRFAGRYAEDKRQLRGWGPERIAAALRERGVDEELIEAALAVDDAESQTRRAAAILVERGMGCGSEAERGRALRFLAQRGFGLEVGYAAIRIGGDY